MVALLVGLGAFGPARAGAAEPSGVIALTSQNAWVRTSSTPIRLGLKVRSPVPASDLLITVGLYTEPNHSALASRFEFDATLAGQLAGLVQLSLAQFAPSSLPSGSGSVEFYVGGSGLPGKVPAKARQVFQLPCPEGCYGVYPLQVSLDDTITGGTLDEFTTYLIVVPPAVPAQKRLRFSFILPLGAPPALSTAGSPAVPRQTLARLATIASATARWPGAPLTVDLYAQTLLALARSRDHAEAGRCRRRRRPSKPRRRPLQRSGPD